MVATGKKDLKILKQCDGRWVQFLRRMVFHGNRLRRRDFGTYWLRRDGPVPYQSVFLKKSHPFLTNLPKVKFAVSSYFYLTRKSLILLVGLLLYKNCSDRSRRVVHWSLCRMYHASLCTIQSKKFCGDFHFLVTSYLLRMKMTSPCHWLSSFFLGLDTIIT